MKNPEIFDGADIEERTCDSLEFSWNLLDENLLKMVSVGINENEQSYFAPYVLSHKKVDKTSDVDLSSMISRSIELFLISELENDREQAYGEIAFRGYRMGVRRMTTKINDRVYHSFYIPHKITDYFSLFSKALELTSQDKSIISFMERANLLSFPSQISEIVENRNDLRIVLAKKKLKKYGEIGAYFPHNPLWPLLNAHNLVNSENEMVDPKSKYISNLFEGLNIPPANIE